MMEPTEKTGYSIIIPVYNGKNTLPDTLRSVSGLEGASFEIIVVDDASTDNTPEIARSSGAKVVSLAQNSGPATARNTGARHAGYDKVLFTDSDVLVPKRLLTALDRTFQESNGDAVQGTFSDVCPFANYFSQYKNLYNRFVLNQLPDWIDTTFTSITAVRKEAFLNCGGFDENIRGASIEDRTLGRHLIQHGYRIRLDRSLEVVHNKKLTFRRFFQNQFRRSRDLAKLLLRNRSEPKVDKERETTTKEKSGRFGTNSFTTMLRIPLIYFIAVMSCVSIIIPIFLAVTGLFGLLYLYLILPFEWELLRRRGFIFALNGIPVNVADAFVSGIGIGWGLFEFLLLGKKY